MKRLLFFMLTFSAMGHVCGQSLEECRRMARENYPEIRRYELIERTRDYDLSNAARAWLPQIRLTGQATLQSSSTTLPERFQPFLELGGIEMPGMDKDQYMVAVEVSQNIWDGGLSKAQREMARAESVQEQKRLEVSLHAMQQKVDELYFGILLMDEQAELLKASAEVLESNLERMKTYRKNGVATGADVDAVEAELLTARQSLEQVLYSRDSYRRMLELFIARPLSDNPLTRPEIPEIKSRSSAHPRLSLLDAMADKVEAQRRALNVSLMPNVSAFAQGYYGYPGMDMFKSMMDDDCSFNALVGVRMSWNIGAFYTRGNNVAKLNAARQEIELQRELVLFDTDMELTRQEGEIERLRKAVKDDERIVELRRSVRKAAESGFENGTIDTTDLLRKINEERMAELGRSAHEIELLQAFYRLKTTLNQ